MQLTKFPLVLVLLTTTACRANKIFGTSEPNEVTSNLVDAVVNIVTSCYEERIKGIGLAGNLPDTMRRTLSELLIPVVLINNTYNFNDLLKETSTQFQYKLNVFIIEVSSTLQLDTLMYMNMAPSIWWNHTASFFILDMSPGCDKSFIYLHLAWYRYMLNAKVLCYSRENGTLILDYNPFTSQAPISWKQLMVVPGKRYRHPLTIFSRMYQKNKDTCVDLNFEKTNNLGGYRVRIEAVSKRRLGTQSTRGYHSFWSEIDRFFHIFGKTLNVTLKSSNQNRFPIPQTVDIRQAPSWLNFAWNVYSSTYPYKDMGYCIISQFRGHKSQLNKILSVIDTNSQFGMSIVYLISLFFFKFFVGQALVPAFLNLMRMTCNTGFTNLPGNTAPRIYLGCLFFFVVTMQGIFQGNLASLLTQSIPHPNANTLQDIVDFGYKEICYTEASILAIDHDILKNHFITLNKSDTIDDCLAKVRDDPSTVYFGFGDGVTLDLALDYQLHISNPPISYVYFGFNIRRSWALEERTNIIIQKFVEADMFQTWDVKCDPVKLTDYEFDEIVKNNKDFKNLELGELAFAFAILGIGLTFATFTFIIELAIEYKCVCGCGFVMVKI